MYGDKIMNVGDLIELHEISQLKFRYIRGIDTQDWPLVESCFTEDASVWYSGGQFSQAGRDTIMEFLRDLLRPSFVSSHIALHPEIQLTSPTTAEGIWRLQDVVHFTEANPVFDHANIQGGEEMNGAGYYYDQYAKTADGWKISKTGYVRIYEAIERPQGRSGFHVECDPARGVATV
jgi:hypothetical protein